MALSSSKMQPKSAQEQNSVSAGPLQGGDLKAAEKDPCADTGIAKSRYLPLGINLTGTACLVVGGGRIGARKAKTLAAHQAKVTVLAPRLGKVLQQMVLAKEVAWQQREYETPSLKDFALVVAATSDAALNIRIARDAERRGILCCVVSSAHNSRVIFPALYERDGLSVAVHSHGKDCRRSRHLRDELSLILGNQRQKNRLTFAVIGVNRNDVANHIFRLLPPSSDPLAGEGFPASDAIILKTCWRWEAYFLSSTPRLACGKIHAFLQNKIHENHERGNSYYYEKSGLRAYHHLLRVLLGLDSPLLGETEIVGQVRSHLSQQQANSNAALSEVFTSALQEQKRIRKSSGLGANITNWVEAIAQHIERLNCKRALVVGCGKIGIPLTMQLRKKGLEVTAFSNRAGEFDFASRFQSAIIATDRLGDYLNKPAVIILCSRLDDKQSQQVLARMKRQKLDVIDLEGGHGCLRKVAASGQYFSPGGVIPFINGQQAARIAEAEKTACRHTLQWCRKQASVAAPLETIRIVGRNSEVSCIQIKEVTSLLRELAPKVDYQVKPLLSPGDRDRKTPLPLVKAEDFFTRDLDEALLAWRADLAVHSAKDLPQPLPEGLSIAAILPSIAPWECLVSREGIKLGQLPPVARIGISSERRRLSLKALRPDLQAKDIRGNVPDRIRQLDAGRYDALILAAAGLIRLGMEGCISEIFPPAEFPPPPGQGSLALVIRSGDVELRRFLEPLNLASRKRLLCQPE